jgi:hypothetical protein
MPQESVESNYVICSSSPKWEFAQMPLKVKNLADLVSFDNT